MEPLFTINHILSLLGIVIFLGGAALVYAQSLRGGIHSRAQKALALLLVMWGFFFLQACIVYPQQDPLFDYSLMSITTLVIGGSSMIVTLLYPLELSRPGWITPRNVIMLILPFVLAIGIYFLVLHLLGEPVYQLYNIDELLDKISDFNIWFRFVLYFIVCLYVAYLFVNTNTSAIKFQKRCIGDTTPIDKRLRNWLRLFAIGQAALMVIYLVLLLNGSIVTQFIHNLIAILFFAVVVYMARFSPSQNDPAKPDTGACKTR